MSTSNSIAIFDKANICTLETVQCHLVCVCEHALTKGLMCWENVYPLGLHPGKPTPGTSRKAASCSLQCCHYTKADGKKQKHTVRLTKWS